MVEVPYHWAKLTSASVVSRNCGAGSGRRPRTRQQAWSQHPEAAAPVLGESQWCVCVICMCKYVLYICVYMCVYVCGVCPGVAHGRSLQTSYICEALEGEEERRYPCSRRTVWGGEVGWVG